MCVLTQLSARCRFVRGNLDPTTPTLLAGSLKNLAELHLAMGQHREALPLFKRAAVLEASLAPTITTLLLAASRSPRSLAAAVSGGFGAGPAAAKVPHVTGSL